MAEGDKPATPASAKSYVERTEEAVASMRTSMQWLFGVFAAVGAVAFAALQLSDLGALDPIDDKDRLTTAGIALAAVFGGIAAAIWAAARFLKRQPLPIPVLLGNRKLVAKVNGDSTILGSYQTLAAVKDDYDARLVILSDDQRADEHPQASADAEALLKIMRNATARANFLQASRRYSHTLTWSFVGVVLAVTGGAVFAWAVHPPEASTATLPTLVRPGTTVDIAVVTDNTKRRDYLTELLGADCDLATLEGVVLEQLDADTFRIATHAEHDCKAALIEITGTDGLVSLPGTISPTTTVFAPEPPDQNAPAN